MSAELSHSPTDRPSLQGVVQTFRGITDVMVISLTSRKATQTIRERRCRSQSSAEMTKILFSIKSARFSSLSVCLQPVRRLNPHLRSRTLANGSGMLDRVQCRDSPPIREFPVRVVAAPPRPWVREGLGRPWPVYDFGLEGRNIDQQLPARRRARSSLMRHDTKLPEYGAVSWISTGATQSSQTHRLSRWVSSRFCRVQQPHRSSYRSGLSLLIPIYLVELLIREHRLGPRP
jgi:hypothetical protein